MQKIVSTFIKYQYFKTLKKKKANAGSKTEMPNFDQ